MARIDEITSADVKRVADKCFWDQEVARRPPATMACHDGLPGMASRHAQPTTPPPTTSLPTTHPSPAPPLHAALRSRLPRLALTSSTLAT